MPIGKFLWGVSSSGTTPHYQNELLCGYVPYDWLTDRPPREGSEFAQAPSGAEDAWVTGRDYVFDGEFRWIPDRPVSSSGATTANPERSVVAGPLGWQGFLDYCRDKNDFRFVPNVNVPDLYVDTCYLVEPLRGFGGNLADLTRGVRLTLRSTALDFTQAQRGVVFEYQPGAQLRDYSTDAAFSRASAATYLQAGSTTLQGQAVASAGSGVLRDLHRTSSSGRVTLWEAASTNLILQSEDFSSTHWGRSELNVTANDRVAPDASRSTTADWLVATTASTEHTMSSSYMAVTTGEFLSISGFLRGAELTQCQLFVQDTGSDAVGATINLGAGSATGYTEGAAALALSPVVRSLDDSWYHVALSGRFGSSSTSARLAFRLLSTAGTTSFNGSSTQQGIHAWGFQLERLDGPTAYIATSSAAVSRAQDSLKWPWPWKAQAGWWYVRGTWYGSTDAVNATVLAIDTSSGTGFPVLHLRKSTAAGLQARLDLSSTENLTASVATLPAYGDTIELFAHLSTARVLTFSRAFNGSTETSASSTAATIGFPSSTNSLRLFLGAVPGAATQHPSLGVALVKAGMSTGVTTLSAARSA